jgi:para-nitrobenzyl esterase
VREVLVETTSGGLRGSVTDNGICAFKGVRYGQSTAGRARFQAPGAPPQWSGILDALA